MRSDEVKQGAMFIKKIKKRSDVTSSSCSTFGEQKKEVSRNTANYIDLQIAGCFSLVHSQLVCCILKTNFKCRRECGTRPYKGDCGRLKGL
jgi:hypothetical protein